MEKNGHHGKQKLVLLLLAVCVSVGLIVGGVFMLFYQTTKQATNIIALGGYYSSRIEEKTGDLNLTGTPRTDGYVHNEAGAAVQDTEDTYLPYTGGDYTSNFTLDYTAKANLTGTNIPDKFAREKVWTESGMVDTDYARLLPSKDVEKSLRVYNNGTVPMYVKVEARLTVKRTWIEIVGGQEVKRSEPVVLNKAALTELFQCLDVNENVWWGPQDANQLDAANLNNGIAVGVWYYGSPVAKTLSRLGAKTATEPVFTTFTFRDDILGKDSKVDFYGAEITLEAVGSTVQITGSGYASGQAYTVFDGQGALAGAAADTSGIWKKHVFFIPAP